RYRRNGSAALVESGLSGQLLNGPSYAELRK
ncbi:MAG: hypothetical protein ACI9G5_002343, partial [Paracoccaceae bacterium]